MDATVWRTFQEFIDDLDREDIHTLQTFGADGGVGGMTNYSETSALYETFGSEIWRIVGEVAEQHGQTTLEYVAATYGERVGVQVQFEQVMVFLAAEYLASQQRRVR